MATPTGVAPEIPRQRPEGGSADGAPTELAALEAARSEKRELLDRAASTAVSELGPKAKLPGDCAVEDLPALTAEIYNRCHPAWITRSVIYP